jgi:uncharacterized protein YbbK (DUF523 family)
MSMKKGIHPNHSMPGASLPITAHDKDAVLVSLCLCGVPCRYHGLTHKMGSRLYREKKIAHLNEKYSLIPVCPDTLGGLPTPRCTCTVFWEEDLPRVVNTRTGEPSFNGKDLTEAYRRGAEWTLWMARVFSCKKAYMLKNSPSCDPKNGVTGRALTAAGIQVIGV